MKPEQEANFMVGVVEGMITGTIDPLKKFLKTEASSLTPDEMFAIAETTVSLDQFNRAGKLERAEPKGHLRVNATRVIEISRTQSPSRLGQ